MPASITMRCTSYRACHPLPHITPADLHKQSNWQAACLRGKPVVARPNTPLSELLPASASAAGCTRRPAHDLDDMDQAMCTTACLSPALHENR